METYKIHGYEIEYDTFDLENMERFDQETRRVVQAARSQTAEKDYLATARQQANSMLTFFDGVLGEGMAQQLFGAKVNIRDLLQAYRQFTEDVAAAFRDAFEAEGQTAAPVVPHLSTPRARIVTRNEEESI